MPYIKPYYRSLYDDEIERLNRVLSGQENVAGDLNYVITSLVNAFIQRRGGNYQAHNAAIGVLECVKLELYRRRTAPYEDIKIVENGDVA